MLQPEERYPGELKESWSKNRGWRSIVESIYSGELPFRSPYSDILRGAGAIGEGLRAISEGKLKFDQPWGGVDVPDTGFVNFTKNLLSSAESEMSLFLEDAPSYKDGGFLGFTDKGPNQLLLPGPRTDKANDITTTISGKSREEVRQLLKETEGQSASWQADGSYKTEDGRDLAVFINKSRDQIEKELDDKGHKGYRFRFITSGRRQKKQTFPDEVIILDPDNRNAIRERQRELSYQGYVLSATTPLWIEDPDNLDERIISPNGELQEYWSKDPVVTRYTEETGRRKGVDPDVVGWVKYEDLVSDVSTAIKEGPTPEGVSETVAKVGGQLVGAFATLGGSAMAHEARENGGVMASDGWEGALNAAMFAAPPSTIVFGQVDPYIGTFFRAIKDPAGRSLFKFNYKSLFNIIDTEREIPKSLITPAFLKSHQTFLDMGFTDENARVMTHLINQAGINEAGDPDALHNILSFRTVTDDIAVEAWARDVGSDLWVPNRFLFKAEDMPRSSTPFVNNAEEYFVWADNFGAELKGNEKTLLPGFSINPQLRDKKGNLYFPEYERMTPDERKMGISSLERDTLLDTLQNPSRMTLQVRGKGPKNIERAGTIFGRHGGLIVPRETIIWSGIEQWLKDQPERVKIRDIRDFLEREAKIKIREMRTEDAFTDPSWDSTYLPGPSDHTSVMMMSINIRDLDSDNILRRFWDPTKLRLGDPLSNTRNHYAELGAKSYGTALKFWGVVREVIDGSVFKAGKWSDRTSIPLSLRNNIFVTARNSLRHYGKEERYTVHVTHELQADGLQAVRNLSNKILKGDIESSFNLASYQDDAIEIQGRGQIYKGSRTWLDNDGARWNTGPYSQLAKAGEREVSIDPLYPHSTDVELVTPTLHIQDRGQWREIAPHEDKTLSSIFISPSNTIAEEKIDDLFRDLSTNLSQRIMADFHGITDGRQGYISKDRFSIGNLHRRESRRMGHVSETMWEPYYRGMAEIPETQSLARVPTESDRAMISYRGQNIEFPDSIDEVLIPFHSDVYLRVQKLASSAPSGDIADIEKSPIIRLEIINTYPEPLGEEIADALAMGSRNVASSRADKSVAASKNLRQYVADHLIDGKRVEGAEYVPGTVRFTLNDILEGKNGYLIKQKSNGKWAAFDKGRALPTEHNTRDEAGFSAWYDLYGRNNGEFAGSFRDLFPANMLFEENWHLPALKLEFIHAAQNGRDAISISSPKAILNQYGEAAMPYRQSRYGKDSKNGLYNSLARIVTNTMKMSGWSKWEDRHSRLFMKDIEIPVGINLRSEKQLSKDIIAKAKGELPPDYHIEYGNGLHNRLDTLLRRYEKLEQSELSIGVKPYVESDRTVSQLIENIDYRPYTIKYLNDENEAIIDPILRGMTAKDMSVFLNRELRHLALREWATIANTKRVQEDVLSIRDPKARVLLAQRRKLLTDAADLWHHPDDRDRIMGVIAANTADAIEDLNKAISGLLTKIPSARIAPALDDPVEIGGSKLINAFKSNPSFRRNLSKTLKPGDPSDLDDGFVSLKDVLELWGVKHGARQNESRTEDIMDLIVGIALENADPRLRAQVDSATGIRPYIRLDSTKTNKTVTTHGLELNTPLIDENGNIHSSLDILPDGGVRPDPGVKRSIGSAARTAQMRLYQIEGQEPSGGTVFGFTDFQDDGKAIISFSKHANIRTAFHEAGHVIRRGLIEDQLRVAGEWAMGKDVYNGLNNKNIWTRAGEEKFADAYEQYVVDNVLPRDVDLKLIFDKMTEWFVSVIRSITGTPDEKNLSPEMKKLFRSITGGRMPSARKIENNIPSSMVLNAKKYYGHDVSVTQVADDGSGDIDRLFKVAEGADDDPGDVVQPPVETLSSLSSMEDTLNINFINDNYRKIANMPVIRNIVGRFNPSAIAFNPLFKSLMAHQMLRSEGAQKAQIAFTRLSRLGKQSDVFGSNDDDGFLAEGPLKGFTVNGIRSMPSDSRWASKLTSDQREWITIANQIEEAKLDMLKFEGININELSFEEGGVYAGRKVMGKVFADGEIMEVQVMGGGRPGARLGAEKERKFRTQEEGILAGYRYLDDDETLLRNLEGAYRRVADQRATDYLIQNNIVSSRTKALPSEILTDLAFAKEKLKGAERLIEVLQGAKRGAEIPYQTRRYLEKIFPEIEGMLGPISRITLDQLIKAGKVAATQPSSFTPNKRTITKLFEYTSQLEYQLKLLNQLRQNTPASDKAKLESLDYKINGKAGELSNAKRQLGFLRMSWGKAYENYKRTGKFEYTFSKSAKNIFIADKIGAIDDLLTSVRGVRNMDKGSKTYGKYQGGLLSSIREDLSNAQLMKQDAEKRSKIGALEGDISLKVPSFAGKIFDEEQPLHLKKRDGTAMTGRDVARAIGENMVDNSEFFAALNSVNTANSMFRFFQLAGDMSPFGIQLIFLWGQTLHNPLFMAKAMKGFVSAFLDPTFHANYIHNNREILAKHPGMMVSTGGTEMTEFTRIIGHAGFVRSKPVKMARDVLEQVPGASAAGRGYIGFLRRAQTGFETALDVSGIELAKALDRHAVDSLSTRQVDDFINEIRGLANPGKLGTTAKWRQFETLTVLAPRYNRAIAAMLFDLGRPTSLRGELAWKAVSSGVVSLMAFGTAVSLAIGEDPDEIINHFDPRSDRFMTWQIPGTGTNIGFGSKVRSLMRVFGSMIATHQRGEDLTLTDVTMDNPGIRFLRGNASPVLSSGVDILVGRTFMGDRTRGDSFWDIKGHATNLTKTEILPKTMPIWAQAVLLEGGNPQQRIVKGVAEFFGGRGYPEGSFQIMQKYAQDTVNIPYEKMQPFERDLLRENLSETLEPMMMERIMRGDKDAQYWMQLKQLDTERYEKEIALLEQYYNPRQNPIFLTNGAAKLKSEFNNLQTEYARDRQELNRHFGKYQDDTEFDKDNPANFILSEWYATYDLAEDPKSGVFSYDAVEYYQREFWKKILPTGEPYTNYEQFITMNTIRTRHHKAYYNLLPRSTVQKWKLAEEARAKFLQNRGNWSKVLDSQNITR